MDHWERRGVASRFPRGLAVKKGRRRRLLGRTLRGTFKPDDAHYEGDSDKIRKAESLVLAFGQASSFVADSRGKPSCVEAVKEKALRRRPM